MSIAKSNEGGSLYAAGMKVSRVNPMRVKKDTQRIFVTLTDQTRIKGVVYLPQSGRLSDLMNHQAGDRPFLAMTDAVVLLPDGIRHKAEFLAVNRTAVTTCFPAPNQDEDAKPLLGKAQTDGAKTKPKSPPAGAPRRSRQRADKAMATPRTSPKI